MSALRAKSFFVELCDLQLLIPFGVVESLVVQQVNGTSFIHKFVEGIFAVERRVVPIQSRSCKYFRRTGPIRLTICITEQVRR